jgi:hypothetical protein
VPTMTNSDNPLSSSAEPKPHRSSPRVPSRGFISEFLRAFRLGIVIVYIVPFLADIEYDGGVSAPQFFPIHHFWRKATLAVIGAAVLALRQRYRWGEGSGEPTR